MARKTEPVRVLTEDALAKAARPLTEDVIQDCFIVVESDPALRARFDVLKDVLGKNVTKQWFGVYVRRAVKGTAIKQVGATKTTLARSYSKLDFKR